MNKATGDEYFYYTKLNLQFRYKSGPKIRDCAERVFCCNYAKNLFWKKTKFFKGIHSRFDQFYQYVLRNSQISKFVFSLVTVHTVYIIENVDLIESQLNGGFEILILHVIALIWPILEKIWLFPKVSTQIKSIFHSLIYKSQSSHGKCYWIEKVIIIVFFSLYFFKHKGERCVRHLLKLRQSSSSIQILWNFSVSSFSSPL